MSLVLRAASEAPVIMVDDSEDDALIAAQCYRKSNLAHPFQTFASGAALLDYLDAVAAGRARMPAVVLLDINMPGLDGFEVLQRIREREAFAQLPVIMMLTNSDNPRDIERAAELGANGFQTKPATMKEYVRFFDSLAP